MQSEAKEYGIFPDEEEILKKTDELAELLCQTDGYRRYKKHLAALKEEPEVYQQLNEFRLKNMELQLDKDEHYYEKAEELYPGFQRYYSYLCEFVHPNYDGVSQSYSVLHIDEDYTTFGPNLKSSHELYDSFTITLVLALSIYLNQIQSIEDNLENFIHLCDIDIVKKISE